MMFPRPDNTRIVTWPEVEKALYAFIKEFAVPSVPENNIFWGNQNRMHLPENSNEFVIMTFIGQSRVGTNVETFDAKTVPHDSDGKLTIKELITCDIQLDFYSDGHNARQRAQAVETIARSPSGVRFLKDYGISCLYADDVREMTEPLDANEYVCRSMTTIHIQFWTGVTQEIPWFDKAHIGIKDVDVVFPPTE